jgi:hypothetical protein
MSDLISTIEEVKTETDSALRPVNTAFSTKVPNLQLYLDSTSLGDFKSCAQLYKYRIIDGYSSPYSSTDLFFGILFHSATEVYERSRASGIPHDESVIDALRHAVMATWDNEKKRPWTSDVTDKSRNTLLRTIVWYLDTFKDENLKTVVFPNGDPAVEVSFRFDTGIRTEAKFECPVCFGAGAAKISGARKSEDSPGDIEFTIEQCTECNGTGAVGEPFYLCGHLDRVVYWNSELWIMDKKTTRYALDDNYFRQFSPDNQMSLYSVAGAVTLESEVGGLIIDGCQVLVTGSRFRRKTIPRSPEQLEEWLVSLKHWLHWLEYCAKNDYWPQNERSCGYGNRQCQFRPVCSSDPSTRQEMLDGMYVRRTWDPLIPR